MLGTTGVHREEREINVGLREREEIEKRFSGVYIVVRCAQYILRDPRIYCAELGSKVCARKSKDGASPHFVHNIGIYILATSNAKLFLTCMDEESSTLALSAASLTLCRAMLSVETSSPCCVVIGEDGGERGRENDGRRERKV